MEYFITRINAFVWGIPALILILGVGLYLSIKTRFVQVRLFPEALKTFLLSFRSKGTSYKALCTALAATIGTGNLVGVAGAIAIGGPGSIFWMWVCALLGMATKFAESTLAVCYQKKNEKGERVGGPMYMIRDGLEKNWHWLSGVYCFMGVAAAFGVGNATQVNAITGGIRSAFLTMGFSYPQWGNLAVGVGVSVLILLILLGGAGKIGDMAQKLVPAAAAIYLLLGTGILILRSRYIPAALHAIVSGAFRPQAVTGGVISSIFTAVRVGAARGVFTNEAGMGTAAIAHGSASVRHPVQQGLMGIMEVFLDTIVICTLTALVILCSGISIPFSVDMGAAITSSAFTAVCGTWASVCIALILCCFAFATILGWGLYGARCAQFLFGDGVWSLFVWIQAITVIIGSLLKTGVVWMISETVNGLMAIPNLIALALLCPKLVELMGDYEKGLGKSKKS